MCVRTFTLLIVSAISTSATPCSRQAFLSPVFLIRAKEFFFGRTNSLEVTGLFDSLASWHGPSYSTFRFCSASILI